MLQAETGICFIAQADNILWLLCKSMLKQKKKYERINERVTNVNLIMANHAKGQPVTNCCSCRTVGVRSLILGMQELFINRANALSIYLLAENGLAESIRIPGGLVSLVYGNGNRNSSSHHIVGLAGICISVVPPIHKRYL